MEPNLKIYPRYPLTGSLAVAVQQGTKKAGRPIASAGDWVWHQRGVVELLRSWCDVAKLNMQLTHYDGSEFNVMWLLHDSNAINTSSVDYQAPEDKNYPYTATFKLMAI